MNNYSLSMGIVKALFDNNILAIPFESNPDAAQVRYDFFAKTAEVILQELDDNNIISSNMNPDI